MKLQRDTAFRFCIFCQQRPRSRIIILIIFAAFFVSRMKTGKPPPPVVFRRRVRLSGKLRLAIAASVVFLVMSAAYYQPWATTDYIFLGIAPVVLAWLLYWVFIGFKNR